LSPCRLAGGDPGDTADAFAMAVLRADRPAARALETAGARRVYRLVTRPVTSARAARAVARRRDLTSSSLCHDLAGPALAHCYVYPLGAQVLPVYVGLRCEARDWRVAVAF
jgi:hypothetical protein